MVIESYRWYLWLPSCFPIDMLYAFFLSHYMHHLSCSDWFSHPNNTGSSHYMQIKKTWYNFNVFNYFRPTSINSIWFNAHFLLAHWVRQGVGIIGDLLSEEECEGWKENLAQTSVHLLLSCFEGIRKSSVQYFIINWQECSHAFGSRSQVFPLIHMVKLCSICAISPLAFFFGT